MVQVMTNVELCLWNAGEGDPPSVRSVRDALERAGLSTTHAEDIPTTTAFRRACDSLRKKDRLIRVFKKDGDLHAQFDNEMLTGNKLQRTVMGVYRCHPTNRILGINTDDDQDLESELQGNFNISLYTYEWGDVSTVIQSVISKCGLGAYSPRKSGGIYFIPANPDRPALLDQIERFCEYVDIRFLRYVVPDTETQRSEIMDAVSAGIEQDVIAHETAIAEYTDASSAILEKRKNAIDSSLHLLRKLQGLLGARYDALFDRLTDAKERVAEMKTALTGTVSAGVRLLDFT